MIPKHYMINCLCLDQISPLNWKSRVQILFRQTHPFRPYCILQLFDTIHCTNALHNYIKVRSYQLENHIECQMGTLHAYKSKWFIYRLVQFGMILFNSVCSHYWLNYQTLAIQTTTDTHDKTGISIQYHQFIKNTNYSRSKLGFL